MQKTALIAHLNNLLATRVRDLTQEIASTLDARNSDTKSSAGDKHEVGRAMVQQELDQLQAQLAKLQVMQQELGRVPKERTHDQVGFGALVHTDQGNYFIAIGHGALEVKGETCYAVSLASPIGQALKDKKVGEKVPFGGRSIVINRIV